MSNEVFAALPILLRSTTPVVSEKVLIWHQTMQADEPLPPERDRDQSEPDTTPPDQNPWEPEPFQHQQLYTQAPTARSSSSPNSARILEDLAASKSGVDYAGVAEIEEVESNVQEKSQVHSRRSSINVKSMLLDEQATPSRRPKHLSQDTVPSFGNLDASAFEPNKESTPTPAAPPMGLQTPKIDIQTPTSSEPEHSLRGSRHSRAPSRMSNVRIGSVHNTDDNETVRDEGDARTVPVETVRPAASHKSRSVASHHPSERGRPTSQASAKPKSRASAISPPPQSVKSHAKSASMHPSQMPLPSSEGSNYDTTPSQTQRTVPLHTYVQSQRASNYAPSQHTPSLHAPSQHAPSHHAPSHHAPSHHAPSQHAPSQHAPSHHAPSQHAPSHHAPSQHAPSHHAPSQHAPSHHAPSQHAPSKASNSGTVRSAFAKETSQVVPSVQGSTAPKQEKRETSLHPLSYHQSGSLYQGSHYGDSKYAGSQQGVHGQPPSLHPLTQHLQAHPQGSHRTHSRLSHTQSQSPYIPPHTAEDMIHASIRGRAVSPTPSNPHGLPPPPFPQAFIHQSHQYSQEYRESQSQLRDDNRDDLDDEQQQMIDEILMRTPRTSHTITPSALAAEVHNSSFHDEDLCVLLHAADDDTLHDVVKKAVRKAIRGRVRKLGVKHENEAILLQRFRSPDGSHHRPHHHHVPQQIAQPQSPPERAIIMQQDQEPPTWVKDMMMMMQDTRSRLEDLERKKKSGRSYVPTESQVDNEGTVRGTRHRNSGECVNKELENASPITITMAMNTPGRTGTIMEESILQPGETEFTRADSERGHTMMGASELQPIEESERAEGEVVQYAEEYAMDTGLIESINNTLSMQDEEVKSRQELNRLSSEPERDDSPGKQVLEEEIYKLRVKASRSEHSHRTWEIQQDDEPGHLPFVTESELMPEIPDIEGTSTEVLERKTLPAIPDHRGSSIHPYTQGGDYVVGETPAPPPWQRIHQRLLGWALAWPMSELDQALNSTTREHQVDEVALTIWSSQTYKRYVRARLTEHPPSRVDRLFIPPNVADAINSAVYNGRHADACGMLRDMWAPLGLDGMPRLLLVLSKHRREENHWVAHRFSLPDGSLTTYDTYPERSLPDGRPLGWWFAIRIAWPHALYPSPDQLAQRMVRIHRPMQLGIDNSLATAGIWRNLLMGSKAERSVDLERLRDLINTEVKNLRQRKDMGKLSVAPQRPNWEDMP